MRDLRRAAAMHDEVAHRVAAAAVRHQGDARGAGARAQLVTGLVLVGLAETGDEELNNTKVGVKLLVAVAVAACAEVAAAKERKKQGPRPQLVTAAGVWA